MSTTPHFDPAASSGPRIGVAMIVQESNTFTPTRSDLLSFRSQGLWTGADAAKNSSGTNTEIAGALSALTSTGFQTIPLVRGWAMSGGVITTDALQALCDLLTDQIDAAGPLDGLVLSLHGALVGENLVDGDAALLDAARNTLGPDVPIVISLDLHANVTTQLVQRCDGVVGFRTYPHVDQGETGVRAAQLLTRILADGPVATALAKLPMLVPAESQGTAVSPMADLRDAADIWMQVEDIHDVSLFPVQPWLDVPDLGFAVTVVADTSARAAAVAEDLRTRVWASRHAFTVDLVAVPEAIRRALQDRSGKPAVLAHSSDSPTSGCTADSPAVLAHIECSTERFTSAVAIVDGPAVGRCSDLDVGEAVTVDVGATLNPTWDSPVTITGTVYSKGSQPVRLVGPSMTGQDISIGRWCVVRTLRDTYVLLTEYPAPTFDPATWSTVDVSLANLDIVSIRSANMFRAGYAGLIGPVYLLDLPGASTPNLKHLKFEHGAQQHFPFVDEAGQ